MAFFTKQQIDEIERQLAARAVKDTDFEETTVLTDSDYVAVVQNGVNKKFNWRTLANDENQRIENEAGRVEAENSRVLAENTRDNAENNPTTGRNAKEAERQDNEVVRQENEQHRIYTEGQMQEMLDSIVVNFLADTDVYEQAVEAGFEGTREDWLASVLGVKGVGIYTWEVDPSTADSGYSVHTITMNDAVKPGGPTVYTFNVKNGKGITAVVQETVGIGSDAENVYRVDYSEGASTRFTVKNGGQGNTGSSVDYPFELVNNVTTNDSTKALTAAMGKQLQDDKVSAINVTASVEEVPDNYYTKSETADYVGTRITDDLTSTSATQALSAKQGKVLAEQVNQLGQYVERVYLGVYRSTSKISITFNDDGGFTISVTGGLYVFGDSERRNIITYTSSNVSNTFNGPLSDGFLYVHKLSATSFEFAFRSFDAAALSAADGYYFIGFVDFIAKKATLTPWCAFYDDNDNFPTKGSDKLITSSGVFNGIAARLPFFTGVNFSFDFSGAATWKLTLTNKGNYYPSFTSFNGRKVPLSSAFFTELTFNDISFGWLWYDIVNNTFVYSNYDPASYQTYVNSENYFLVAACNPYFGEVIPYGFDAENMVITCDINKLLKTRDSVKLSPCDYLVKTPVVLGDGKTLCGSFGKTRLILTDGCTTAISASSKSNIKVSDLEIVGTETEYTAAMNGIVAGDGYNLLSIEDIYVTYPGEQHGGSVRSTPHIANMGDEIGINLYYCENVLLESLKINHINGSAIRVNHVGMNYEKGLNCSNLFITNCYNGIWTENEHEFSQYSNFTITKCQVGILISSGNLIFNGGHITKGRVGIAFTDGYNHGHGVIDSIEIKHNQLYGIYAKDCDYGECIGTASIQYSPILLDNCKGFVIGTLFFSSGSIICSNPSGYTQNNVITTILNQGGSTISETGNLKILNQFVG